MMEPSKETVESMLKLSGWSGVAIELMEWYLHDYDPWDEEAEAWERSQIRKLNSLIQSRINEIPVD